jgi:hypothetical protein
MSAALELPQVVNEFSSAVLAFAFTGTTGAPVVPQSLKYRVDCLTSGQAVRGMTTVPPLADVQIVLTPDDNTIRVPGHNTERRLVTLVATAPGGEQSTLEVQYTVRNLRYLNA